VAASLTARTRSSTTSPGMAAGSSCKLLRTARPQPGKAGRPGGNRDFQLLPAAGVAALLSWWGVLQARVVQLGHREGVGATWRQPSGSPRQSPPAVTVIAAPFSHGAVLARPPDPPQPVQLCGQRPGAVLQVLQVAVAVEWPAVDAARPAAPVAGLRGARTGVIGLGPAAASVSLADPRSGRDGDLPGPARLPAAQLGSPPLAWCQAPTNPPSRRARPGRSRVATVLPGGGVCRARPGCGWRPEGATAAASSTTVPCPDIRLAAGRCCVQLGS
jgi:hypothetical protein